MEIPTEMKFNSYDSPAALQQTPLPPEGGGELALRVMRKWCMQTDLLKCQTVTIIFHHIFRIHLSIYIPTINKLVNAWLCWRLNGPTALTQTSTNTAYVQSVHTTHSMQW